MRWLDLCLHTPATAAVRPAARGRQRTDGPLVPTRRAATSRAWQMGCS